MENERLKLKDMGISARVNSDIWKKFKRECIMLGLSPNAGLNMVITDFVRKNEHLLEDITKNDDNV